MNYKGSAYIGTADIQSSTANQELIQSFKPTGFSGAFILYKMSFINQEECHVKINGGNSIYLSAGQGFQMNDIDCPIYTFVIVEAGVHYNLVGAY